MSAGSKLSRCVSEALREKRWCAAGEKLVELSREDVGSAKLGSLQRWVRDADGAREDDETWGLKLLWLLCRVAAGERIDRGMPEKVRIDRLEPWAPKDRGVGEEVEERDCALLDQGLFWIAHREAAAERQPPNRYDLQVWGSRCGSTSLTSCCGGRVRRVEVPGVPGAFVLNDVLSRAECSELLGLLEAIGFEPDEPIDSSSSLLPIAKVGGGFAALCDDEEDELSPPPPRKEKSFGSRSKTVVWLADKMTNDSLFDRCVSHLPQHFENCSDARGAPRGRGDVCGFNARWRCYKYDAGGIYRPHIDGAWPGSGISQDGAYQFDAYGDRLSKLTAVVYLNEHFDGGSTAFYKASSDDDDFSLGVTGVKPRTGSILFFPHGDAVGSLLHEGASVRNGSKFIIRTEVLYRYASSAEKGAFVPSKGEHKDQKLSLPRQPLGALRATTIKKRRRRRR